MKDRRTSKKVQPTLRAQGVQSSGDEYDLGKNLHKINSYSKSVGSKRKGSNQMTQTQDENSGNPRLVKAVDSHYDTLSHTHTGGLSRDEYFRLEDKLTSFNTQNDQAHTTIRLELERKIAEGVAPIKKSIDAMEDKMGSYLTKQWYTWTIIGLVAIVGVWFMFSYIDVHPLPARVKDVENRLDNMNEQIRQLTNDSIHRSKSNNSRPN